MLELVFAVVFLFYPSCSAAAFSAFSCEDFEGTRYLKADYSIDCDVAHNVERLLRARKGDVHAPIVAQERGACAVDDAAQHDVVEFLAGATRRAIAATASRVLTRAWSMRNS